MTEEQGDKIIELLEGINSKLYSIEINTSELSNFTSEMYILDEIKKILRENN